MKPRLACSLRLTARRSSRDRGRGAFHQQGSKVWGLIFIPLLLIVGPAVAEELVTVEPQIIIEWKAVYGQVETRDRVPARARIGGLVVELDVIAGDRVSAGQRVATVEDDKLAFQRAAIEARCDAAQARLATARSDLERGEALFERGTIASQRLDELRTDVSVISGELATLKAEARVIEQRVAEGGVLSPVDGLVLSVPVSHGSVITPGDVIAEIGGGGLFLRLAVPERHAGQLAEGDVIELATDHGETGRLAKLYPLIESGRIEADVEVEGLDARFVGRRMPVRLPVGEREAILVPETAVERVGALDMVTVETGEGRLHRVVVPGGTVSRDGVESRIILSGLAPGDRVVIANE